MSNTEKIEQQIREDLREFYHFFGSWDELRKVIDQEEENHNEEMGERAMNENGAWEGGFADNH